MKLRNKLLIIAVPAATIATFAPLSMTSCNKNALTFEIDAAKLAKGEWQPSGTQLEGEYTNEEMTAKYFDFIKVTPMYFAEDLLLDTFSASGNIKGSVKIWVNNINAETRQISFKLSEEIYTLDESESLKMYLEYVNIPYKVIYDDGFELDCSWDEAGIKQAKNWKIYQRLVETGPGPLDEEIIATDLSTNEEKIEILNNVLEICPFYLEKCTHKAE